MVTSELIMHQSIQWLVFGRRNQKLTSKHLPLPPTSSSKTKVKSACSDCLLQKRIPRELAERTPVVMGPKPWWLSHTAPRWNSGEVKLPSQEIVSLAPGTSIQISSQNFNQPKRKRRKEKQQNLQRWMEVLLSRPTYIRRCQDNCTDEVLNC